MDWHHGYFVNNGYSHGFYPEMAPLHLAWAGLLQGARLPTRAFRYVDLGCGQGFGLALTAALHPDSEFVGIDFMPAHIAHGRKLARDAGLDNLHFIEGDFIELARHPERVETFAGSCLQGRADYVVAHGIAAWVAPAVREAVWALAGALLRPGGLHYTSYNTPPGWLASMPLQHLIMLRESQGQHGLAAVQAARETLSTLKEAKSPLFTHLPGLRNRVESLDTQNGAYITQEYNNEYWQPQWVASMMREGRAAKLDWLGTANLAEIFPSLLSSTVARLLEQESSTEGRETVRDLALAASFRRDLFLKGRFTGWPDERDRALADWRFTCLTHRTLKADEKSPEKTTLKTSAGQLTVDREPLQRMLDCAHEQGRVSLEDLRVTARLPDVGKAVLPVSLLLAVHALHHAPEPVEPARAFNRAVLLAGLDGAPYASFAAPALGTGLGLDATERLFATAALLAEETAPPGTALDVERLTDQLRTMKRGLEIEISDKGVRLEPGSEGHQRILRERVSQFLVRNWPRWKRAGMV
jgi:SAM-dependent methyltransferase